MEEFKKEMIDYFEFKPKVSLKYFDDTLVIWPHGDTLN